MLATTDALLTDPFQILAVLLAVLALLFGLNRTAGGQRLFRVLPLLLFAYFVPTALSNSGLLPLSSPVYDVVKTYFLPASLILLVLTVDIPAILRLGSFALVLFFTATVSIMIGGPLAYLACSSIVPAELGEEAWKGLATLSGSWIGGGANMIAIKESVGASDGIMGLIIVIDVAVANVWMACLLFFAGRNEAMDAKLGARRESIEEVRGKVAAYQAEVARPTSMPDLFVMLAIAMGVTVAACWLGYEVLPTGQFISEFTWVVLIASAVGLALSFTRFRRLEGAGASAVGSVFLYLLVATIGAKAEFAKIAEAPELVLVGAVWMAFHAAVILIVRHKLKAPIFFAAVGSKANIGGAASAPIVASAFHPALAPVGVLLAILGYFLGTYAGLGCAWGLKFVHGVVGG